MRGRIIQAYFNGIQIVIYKTELFHFAPLERARKLIDIFVRFMASTPVGNTTEMTRIRKAETSQSRAQQEEEEQQQQQQPDPFSQPFTLRQRSGNIR